jgi:hypothetical protein
MTSGPSSLDYDGEGDGKRGRRWIGMTCGFDYIFVTCVSSRIDIILVRVGKRRGEVLNGLFHM